MCKKVILIGVVLLSISCGASSNANLEAENAKLKEENARLHAQLGGKSESPTQQKAQIPIQNPVLEIKVLKVYQSSSSYTALDFGLINRSDQFIHFWKIGADIFNSKEEYLAHDNTNGNNLRPGQAITHRILFPNVNASEINSWKLSVDSISVDTGGGRNADATRYFELKESRP